MDITNYQEKGEFAAQVLQAINPERKACLDVHLDDGQLWGAETLMSLPSDSTLVCQSVGQIDEMLGETESGKFIDSFKEWEFFASAEKKTAEKAVELSDQKIELSAVMSLGRGDSFLIERTVRKTTLEKKFCLTYCSQAG